MSIDQNTINALQIEIEKDKIAVYNKLRKLLAFLRAGSICLLICSAISAIPQIYSAYNLLVLIIGASPLRDTSEWTAALMQNVVSSIVWIVLAIVSICLIISSSNEISDCDHHTSTATATIKIIRSKQYQ
jgi:hypothetical protein